MKKIILFFYCFIIFFFWTVVSYGANFPADSINIRWEVTWNVSSGTLLTVDTGATFTVLHESFNFSKTTTKWEVTVFCENVILFHAEDVESGFAIERPKMAKCNDYIQITTSWFSSNLELTYSIIYTPYELESNSTLLLNTDDWINKQIFTQEQLLDIYVFELTLLLFFSLIVYLHKLFAPKAKKNNLFL